MKEREKGEPDLLSEINKNLEGTTVEDIARQLEIHPGTVRDWIREDESFANTMNILKDVQRSEKSTTVDSLTIASILMNKRDQRRDESD